MSTNNQTDAQPKWMIWVGWLLGVLPCCLLVMSGVMKLMQPEDVVKGFADLGWPLKLAVPLAIVELACTAIYLIPHTAVLGAILLTGYLGGAIATHVRLEEPFWIPLVLGAVVWLGIYLREPRLRVLVPWRK